MGIFVKIMNNFMRAKFGDYCELNFIMQGGNMRDIFSVWLWENMNQFYKGPKFGVEMKVW